MKLIMKLPKSNPKLHLNLIEDNWIPMKEPKNVASAILLSIPLMIIAGSISIFVLNIVSSISLSEFGITTNGYAFTIYFSDILWLVLLLVLHELIHLIFIPNFIKSEKTYAGLTVFGGFVFTEEEISKARYIIITIAPFVIISLILPLVLSVFGLLTTTVKFLIILNALGSSVDLLNLILVIKQVPKNAVLKSNGPYTYWRNR